MRSSGRNDGGNSGKGAGKGGRSQRDTTKSAGKAGQAGKPARSGPAGKPSGGPSGKSGQAGRPFGKPAQSGKPTQAGKPAQSGKPTQAGKPAQSGKPSRPGQTSGKPPHPGQAGKPGKAGKPGAAGAGKRNSSTSPRSRAAQRAQRPRELQAQLETVYRERQRNPSAPARVGRGSSSSSEEGERLQKVLAQAGLGSRRTCETLIDQGRVEVNGERVHGQGKRVNPSTDEIKLDGLTIASQDYLFFALNKPAGVISTMEDSEGRQCLGDYVANRETRLFHVGRLDTKTEGLILLTNHGELAHRLTHPHYGVPKTYLASIVGPIPRDLGKRLKAGIALEDGLARADQFRVVQNTGNNYLVEISLHEGRKHIVLRMMEEVGFPVSRLVRTKFGPIALGDQKSGWLRRLTNPEVGMLLDTVQL